MLSRMRNQFSYAAMFLMVICGFAGSANAACASKPVRIAPLNLFESPKVTAAPDTIQESAFADNDSEFSGGSIVGLWHIKYFVGNSKTLWDEGFEQWHSDGTELSNDNAVPPSLGNVCVGVYKQTGPRTFKLRHVTWNFDVSGALTGTFELLQTVTVSNNGRTFIGTYTSDSRDLSGNIIPSLHAEGVLSATRITVD